MTVTAERPGPPVPMAPGRLPLIGHTLQLFRTPWEFLASLPALGELVEIRLGTLTAYVACSPKVVHDVLTNSRTFDKGGPMYDKLRPLIGNGLISSPYEEHRRQRRLVQPAFQADRLAAYTDVMRDQIVRELANWREGTVIDVHDRMYQVTTATAAKTMFSADIAEHAADQVARSLPVILAGVYRRAMDPTGVLGRLPTSANRRYHRALRAVHALVDDLIRAYRESGADHGDVLSMLLSAHDEDGGALSDAEVHDQVISLFLAGTETAAATAAWVCHFLALHPKVADEVAAEADTVLDGRPVGWEDLPRLTTTQRVINEALRIYPPVWLGTRTATEDTSLAGHHLKAGSVVLWSPYPLHHQDDLHPDPDRFDPDRWSSERTRALERCAFVPFAVGARQCIGDRFGLTEVAVITATISGAGWRFRPLPEDTVVPAPRTLTLHPRRLRLRLERTPRI